MVTAYVTIVTSAGTSPDVLEELRALDAVQTANIVAGEYDIIAQVAAETERDLLALVTEDIQSIPGVGRTSSAIVLE